MKKPNDDIANRLRASIRFDAINGDSFERSVCGTQMLQAADTIDALHAVLQILINSIKSAD